MERAFRRWVEEQGGLCLKLQAAGCSGFPDRTILLPDQCAAFIELKQPKGQIRKGQIEWCSRLQELGQYVAVARSLDEAKDFVHTLTRMRSMTS